MKYCRKLILLFSLLIFSFFSFSQQNEYINANEKILFNAKIFTANTEQPWAEAIAIHGNKIIAVGNFDEVKKTVSASASLINMNGQTLLPGFIDSHSHSLDGGAGMLRANVNDSIFQIADLATYAEQVRKDGTGMMENFLVIDGLNISTWSHINELSNIFNNGIYTNIPVFLRGSDGHTEWANKLVLQTAGLTKGFLNNLAAESKKYYGVNENGEPNGFVADSGFDKIDAILPADNTDWDKAAIKAMEYNNGFGITAWLEPAAGDISDTKNIYLEEYKKLSQQNKLTAHVAAVIVADANGDATAQINKLKLLQQKYKGIKNLSLLGFKIFADGVVEYPTQTAAMSMPYTNSESKGALMFDPKKFANFATLADKAKLLVHVHAIGDLAVSEALNGFQAARKANGNSGIPHTITHLQFVLPKDFSRFKQLGVLASLQLLWAFGDVTTIDIVQPYIAPEIFQYQYPARSLLHAGATVCGASDWPVSTANPFAAIYNAETRLGERGVLDSTQCMPRMDMFYAYTINAAKALQMQVSIGSIEPGKYADMILVDRDVFTISPEQMKNTKVLWTMFEGRIIYKAEK